MCSKKLKRFLSVMLSLSMVLSTNMVSFASEAVDVNEPDRQLEAEAPAEEPQAEPEAPAEEPQAEPEAPAEEDTHEHNWVLVRVVRAATCTSSGISLYRCEEDGATEYIPQEALGHTYEREGFVEVFEDNEATGAKKNTEIVTPPTCTEDGTKRHICSDCDTGTEEVAAEKLSHAWSNDDTPAPGGATDIEGGYKVVAPTCEENGYKARFCTRDGCDAVDTEHKIVDPASEATGHSYEDPTTESGYKEGAGTEKERKYCTDPVMMEYTCTNPNCDVEGGKKVEVKIKDGSASHSWDTDDSHATITPASCTKPGGKSRPCLNDVGDHKCAAKSDPEGADIIAPSGHSYVSSVTKNATCTVAGERTYTCSKNDCDEGLDANRHGKTYTEVIPATGHTKVTVPAVPATCAKPGLSEYEGCKNCDYRYTEPTELPIDASTHVYGEPSPVKSATCTQNGIGKYTCENCGASKYDIIVAHHTYEKLDAEGNRATMTEEEYEAYLTKEGETVSTYITGKQAATCTAEGSVTFVCTKACTEGHSKQLVIPMVAHDWKSVTETPGANDPDCQPVKKYEQCSICQEKRNETTEPGPGKHTYVSVAKAATCEEVGYAGEECSKCHASNPSNPKRELKRLGHTYEARDASGAVIESGEAGKKVIAADAKPGEGSKKSTCTVAGKNIYVCTRCADGAQGHQYEETLAKLPHNTAEIVEGKVKEATCQRNAIIVVKCSMCHDQATEVEKDAVEEMGQEAAEAFGYLKKAEHEYVLASTLKSADCTQAGIARYKCKYDGCTETKLDVIPAYHSYQKIVNGKAVPMTVAEYTDYLGKLETPLNPDDYIKAKAGADCSASDSTTFICHKCTSGTGHTFTSSRAHTYDPSGTKAWPNGACNPGTETFTCRDCGKGTIEKTIAATALHTYEDPNAANGGLVTIGATCREPAREGYICTNKGCGKVKPGTTPTVVAGSHQTGHDYEVVDDEGNVVYTDAAKTIKKIKDGATGTVTTPATCTAKGQKKYICADCGESVEGHAYTAETPALGHDWGEDKYIDATCTSSGKVRKVCKRDATHVEEESLGALDPPIPHLWKKVAEKSSAPDCTKPGVDFMQCENCHTTDLKSVPATHNWKEEWVDDHTFIAVCQGSCGTREVKWTEDGWHYCAKENKSVQPKVEAGKKPTCTETGKTDKIVCPSCGTVFQESEPVKALGHEYVWTDVTPEGTPACADRTMQQVCTHDKSHTLPGTKKEPSKVEHNYTEHAVAPETCGEYYRVVRDCTVCGQADPEFKVQEFPELGTIEHNFENGKCTICGRPEYEVKVTMERSGEGKIKITANIPVNNPKWTVTSRGFLYSTSASYPADVPLTLDALLPDPDRTWVVREKTITEEGYTGIDGEINVSSVPDRVVYARAFLTVRDEKGVEREIYSDMVSASYNGLK